MEYTVQIRAGKAVLVDDAGALTGPRLLDKRWIAGDRVGADLRLIHRKPTNVIGVVKAFAPTGMFLVFPAHPALQTILPIRHRVRVGDRVAAHLDEYGRVHILGCYSGGAADDAAVVRRVYPPVMPATFSRGLQGPSLYTADYKDHSDLYTFTIDPETSTDLDDAITLDPENNLLYVHIVDIHAGLQTIGDGGATELRMLANGSTLYLANEHTDHLLPAAEVERMSLNVGVPRAAITVKMRLSAEDGSIDAYDIYPSTICVKRRMSYTDLDVSLSPFSWLHAHAARARDVVTLAMPGLDLRVAGGGLLEHVELAHTNDDAHRFVSFAMIAANFTVSAHLHRRGVRVPNRFHETVGGLKDADVERVTGHPVVDSFLALKRWRGARYDLDARGHFGLGLTDYVHFTSPMRRYADVLVHHLLAGVLYEDEWLATTVDWINAQAAHVRALQRYYIGLKVARYAPYVVKDIYLTGVSAAGIQWYEPTLLINGFTHVSAICDGIRWSFDAGVLRGGGKELKVGDQVPIRSLNYDFFTGAYVSTLAIE